MYKVIIALKEVGRAKSLAEACQMFILEVQKILKGNGCSAQILYEACHIECEEIFGMMNFFAIKDFSFAIGLLQEDGTLSKKPVPYIPKDIAREVFLAAHEDSLAAYLQEHADILARIWEEHPDEKISDPTPGIIITP
ncbi:MAG: hypothetical protein NTX82_01255 [Candidatus Parcubacteria bacterium]|nr:hypothetical protein [Candidatus Parcubacteria bacterium]